MSVVNRKNNLTGFKSPSKTNLVRSKSTEHLVSTHHKGISKKHITDKNSNLNDLSIAKVLHVSKSKSQKSLKTKAKSSNKQIVQQKTVKKQKIKAKKTSLNDSKTIKKIKNIVQINLSEDSFNNSSSSSKTQPLEYFLYQNTYIPIQNSAQRRIVYRIKQIDLKTQQTTNDTFFRKTLEKPIIEECAVGTQKVVITDMGTAMTPRVNQELSIQTEKMSYMEEPAKCFSQTLDDLQFLFLPDQSNFQNFNKQQKVHYKQLFQAIAKKIWTNGTGQLQTLTEEKVEILLYQRQCIQMGMIQECPQQGFPTHAFSVMSYLNNLFAFAQLHYSQNIVDKLQHFYGCTFVQKYKRVLKGQSTKVDSNPVMSEQIFLTFERQLFKGHVFESQVVEKAVHTHNKAIFDAANEELQKFKPFFSSKGQPFPWSINLGMTFFSIDESCLSLLFQQIKEKVMMKFRQMCGILLDYDQFDPIKNGQKHETHIKKLQINEMKMVQSQVAEQNYYPQIEESQLALRTDLSTWILAEILEEACQDIAQYSI